MPRPSRSVTRPRRRLPAILLVGALASAVLLGASSAPAGVDEPDDVSAVPVAEGLAFPAAFAVDRDGRIFYAERASGEIHVVSADGSVDTHWATVPDIGLFGEQGLVGLALHPNYPDTPYVYAYGIRMVPVRDKIKARYHLLRFTDQGASGTDMTLIFEPTQNARKFHAGGPIVFGPDGKLYLTIGDGGVAKRGQSLRTAQGKILRMNPDGSVAGDNPLPRRIYSFGHRNSFGMEFDPQTDVLWEGENGPECNDELNRILPGRNYGWGATQTCTNPPTTPENTNQDGPNPRMPKSVYNPTTAPTGLAFCDGCGLGEESEGSILLGEFNTNSIRRITLDEARVDVADESILYEHDAFVLSVEAGPDGAIYFSDPDGIYLLEAD